MSGTRESEYRSSLTADCRGICFVFYSSFTLFSTWDGEFRLGSLSIVEGHAALNRVLLFSSALVLFFFFFASRYGPADTKNVRTYVQLYFLLGISWVSGRLGSVTCDNGRVDMANGNGSCIWQIVQSRNWKVSKWLD